MNRRRFLTSAAAAALVPVVPKVTGNVVHRCYHIPQSVERWRCVASSGGGEYAVGDIVTLTHSASGEDFRGKRVTVA